MLRARCWQGLFRYQAIKSRRGVSFGRIGGPANPAGLHLIDGRLLQPGTGSRDTAEKCANRFGSL
jgi:hypothetical protein